MMNLPMGTIGDVRISRLICGGNLIIGSAHDRDLLYVRSLMRHYFTDRKIIETWQLCEEVGINTMIKLQDAGAMRANSSACRCHATSASRVRSRNTLLNTRDGRPGPVGAA